MEIYYLRNNWLEGPVDPAGLKDLLAAGQLESGSPAWIAGSDSWTPCMQALQAEEEDEELISFAETACMNASAVLASREHLDLPLPRDLLALRLARERELITGSQAERLLAELLESPRPGSGLPQLLHARGWITQVQRQQLDSSLNHGAAPAMIGGYEIIAELGCGSMGTTYKARQVSMDRVVALKILQARLGIDQNYVRHFEREARMAARLNHVNIATAYEVGSAAGQHYLSMEYVDGKTLSEILAEQGRLEEEQACRIAMQVCHALQHAHGHQMVHRDISTKNILVRTDGQVKLVDMGLARSISPEASAFATAGITVGTPAYISPEQALGRDDVDIRSDIYSLGCVLYEMISGEAPLLGKTPLETISLHVSTPLPPLKAAWPRASDLVCHLVQKMTALDPAERFQTPGEVIDGFAADDRTVRQELAKRETIAPVAAQLEGLAPGKPVEIRLPVDGREYAHLIAQKLDEVLEAANVGHEFQGYAQTLYAELVANAFDHGCKGLSQGQVRIVLELNNAFFRIEVEDPGPGFAAGEMLDKIKKEPLNRARRRGIIQVLAIADALSYPAANRAKAVLYRKSEGSGVAVDVAEDIRFVEIRGKGDLALAEKFRRWVESYESQEPELICLMVRTEWVSSMFVASICELHAKVKEAGSALSVWVEHRSCLRIMEQLGIRSFVRIYDSPETAKMALRYANIRQPARPADAGGEERSPPAPAAGQPAPGEGDMRQDANRNRRQQSRRLRRQDSASPADRGWLSDLRHRLFGDGRP